MMENNVIFLVFTQIREDYRHGKRVCYCWVFFVQTQRLSVSYKPNVSCQTADTFLFTGVAAVVVKETIGFLVYKQIGVSRFEAYSALDSIFV